MRTTYKVPRLRIALVREEPLTETPLALRASSDVVKTFAFLRTHDREEFWCVPLDGKNRPLGLNCVSIGTLTASLVHPREVLKPLILTSAAAAVVVHNHPSSDPTPSREDSAITTRLYEVLSLVGIVLLDHVIIGDAGRYFSFADETTLLAPSQRWAASS